MANGICLPRESDALRNVHETGTTIYRISTLHSPAPFCVEIEGEKSEIEGARVLIFMRKRN